MSSQQTENNNTLLGLPDECKLNIFRFFSKQCAANVSATCRDLYALSNDKSISPEKLPYATLDYFKQMTSGSFKMKSIGEVSAVVSLSDDKIAVAASSHTYILQLTRIGQVKCLAKLTVGGGLALRSLCCLGSNRLGAVDIMFNKYVLDLDKIPPRYDGDTMTETSQKDFLKTIRTNVASDGIYFLTENCFMTTRKDVITVWDYTKPEGEECLRTIIASANIDKLVRLSPTRFACLLAMHDKIEVYDLSEPSTLERIRTLRGATISEFRGFVVLPNKTIAAYGSYRIAADTYSSESKFEIFDLNKPNGKELIKEFNLKFTSSIVAALTLPDGRLACGLANDEIKIFDPEQPNSSVKTIKADFNSTDDGSAESIINLESIRYLTTLEDGRLVALTNRGSFGIYKFKRLQCEPENSGPGCTIT